jgi:hypothetical protein
MASKSKLSIVATDTFRGTLGVKVSDDNSVVWAGYVFPTLNPDSGVQEWAVDAYVGTQELDYFVKDLEVRDSHKGKSSEIAAAVLDFLGAPTFDLGTLADELQKKEITV